MKKIYETITKPVTDVLELAEEMGIPSAFPKNVLMKADSIPEEISEADLIGREDFREHLTVTIDGPDAKDLDDAVSLERLSDGYLLGVHIADVSHYVPESSAIDREALKRGTSVYLGNKVIPMLPKRLSNGICSLAEQEDRLTLSVLMEFDLAGRMRYHRIVKSVIRVDHRMTYPDVKALLENEDPDLAGRYADILPMLTAMNELAEKLRTRRKARGAIDFDFPEPHFLFDADDEPVDAVPEHADCATKLIEDFMLAANETVAEEYFRNNAPFVYRIHEEPDEEKTESMIAFVRRCGGTIEKKGQKLTPREVQKAVESLSGRPEEAMASQMILRSMQQARYSTKCDGHFGLAARYYCHFTSPIRRYPDLQIHRIISDYLEDPENADKKMRHYREILPGVAEQSSFAERRGVEAEREANKLLFCRILKKKVGERFFGIVSSVVRWGVYVELPNMAEGLVHVSKLNEDYFHYDEERGVMVGRLSHREIRVGDSMEVVVAGVDLERRLIDFTPAP